MTGYNRSMNGQRKRTYSLGARPFRYGASFLPFFANRRTIIVCCLTTESVNELFFRSTGNISYLLTPTPTTGNTMQKKSGEQVPQEKKKGKKPFVELVESAGLSKNERRLTIQLTESPVPEERSLFFDWIKQLAEKLKLIKPSIRFATREIQLLFDRSISILSLESFIEELRIFLFPHKEGAIIMDNRITPL